MSANGVRLFVRRWWFIAAALFSLGGWVRGLQGEIGKKVDQTEFQEMARDIIEIKNKLTDMDARQRAFFCEDKPAWCR